jgi:ABC-type amino acid transport substrate-binding protein
MRSTTNSRAESRSHSRTPLPDGQSLGIKKASNIKTLADLKGKTVVSTSGTTE